MWLPTLKEYELIHLCYLFLLTPPAELAFQGLDKSYTEISLQRKIFLSTFFLCGFINKLYSFNKAQVLMATMSDFSNP